MRGHGTATPCEASRGRPSNRATEQENRRRIVVAQPSGGLEGYAALVTGGGTGIGRACAARLAAAAKVIAEVAGNGGSVQFTTCDVTDESSVEAAIAFACEPTGGLDSVVA